MDPSTLLLQERTLMARLVRGLDHDQLVAIPEGHRNNILWNLGHVVVTQQRLHNRLAGLEMYVSPEMEAAFKIGTSPADWLALPDLSMILSLLEELPRRLRDDHKAGRFANFQEYTTATGIQLGTIEDALVFNHFHEGLHMGVMMSLRKLVA